MENLTKDNIRVDATLLKLAKKYTIELHIDIIIFNSQSLKKNDHNLE